MPQSKINAAPLGFVATIMISWILGILLGTMMAPGLQVLPERYWILWVFGAIGIYSMYHAIKGYFPNDAKNQVPAPSPTELVKLQSRVTELISSLRRSVENFDEMFKLYIRLEEREESLELAVTNCLDMIHSTGYPKHICVAEADHIIRAAEDLVAYRPRSAR